MAVRMADHLSSVLDQLRWEPVDRRVRATLHGSPVLDSRDVVLVWEPRRVVPMYAVPKDDVRAELVPAETPALPEHLPPLLGPAHFERHTAAGRSYDLTVAGHRIPLAAFAPDDPDLGGRVVVEWGPFSWVEEIQPVTGHPHDPFTRIDLLESDRHVVVSAAGLTLADSTRAVALHETHLPVRWYLPPEDVRLDLLVESPTTTTCAYKGDARYWTLPARDGEPELTDIAWSYPDPLHEAVCVRDHVCFYAERTDLVLDGRPVSRPVTPWSSPADAARS